MCPFLIPFSQNQARYFAKMLRFCPWTKMVSRFYNVQIKTSGIGSTQSLPLWSKFQNRPVKIITALAQFLCNGGKTRGKTKLQLLLILLQKQDSSELTVHQRIYWEQTKTGGVTSARPSVCACVSLQTPFKKKWMCLHPGKKKGSMSA